MTFQIIIKKEKGSKPKGNYGKTRSEVEENLRKDGYQTMDDGELSKLKHIEKKFKDKYGRHSD